MFVYRFLLYQKTTKVYDLDFQIPVTEDNIDELIDTFQNIDKLTLVIRSRAYIQNQDMIVWHYVLSDKVFKLNPKPYMIVTHKDTEYQNIEVMPRYFKNTRQLKITPNLWDLDNFELHNLELNIPEYFKKFLFRNALSHPLPPNVSQFPTDYNHSILSTQDHNFVLNKIHEQNDRIAA